ncbi:MAG: hypothetical protein AWU57_5742, partial [Marinobacter sp. T13-3]
SEEHKMVHKKYHKQRHEVSDGILEGIERHPAIIVLQQPDGVPDKA